MSKRLRTKSAEGICGVRHWSGMSSSWGYMVIMMWLVGGVGVNAGELVGDLGMQLN